MNKKFKIVLSALCGVLISSSLGVTNVLAKDNSEDINYRQAVLNDNAKVRITNFEKWYYGQDNNMCIGWTPGYIYGYEWI